MNASIDGAEICLIIIRFITNEIRNETLKQEVKFKEILIRNTKEKTLWIKCSDPPTTFQHPLAREIEKKIVIY